MSFFERIRETLAAFADRPLLIAIHETEQRPVTGAELAQFVRRARAFLVQAGVQPGDRVALLAPNSVHWIAADLAMMAHGAISVPLYSRQKPQELSVMLEDCEPTLLIVSDATLEQAILEAWKPTCRIARFEEVFAAGPSSEPDRPLAAADPLTMVYTSGTSGNPKGALINRGNLDYMVEVTARTTERIAGRPSGQDRVFHFLPLCFMGSRIMMLTQLFRGNPLMLSTDLQKLVVELGAADPQFYLNVPAVLERVRAGVGQKLAERGGFALKLYTKGQAGWFRALEDKSSFLDGVWMGLAGLLLFPKIKRQIGRSLEFLICGSAPLSAETQRWFQMIGIPVYQVYGLTETTAIVTIDRLNQIEPGYVGYPIEGCEVKLSEEGELICRGPNVFPGYWKRPEETAEMIRDGWLHTGDQAEFNARGNWRIVGRLKNVLVLESGHNVPPEPLEELLVGDGSIMKQAFVTGHGRPHLAALVVCAEGRQEAVEAWIDRLNDGLPHYRRIRKFRLIAEPATIDNGLLTANGKMRRQAIEARYQAEIEALYR